MPKEEINDISALLLARTKDVSFSDMDCFRLLCDPEWKGGTAITTNKLENMQLKSV